MLSCNLIHMLWGIRGMQGRLHCVSLGPGRGMVPWTGSRQQLPSGFVRQRTGDMQLRCLAADVLSDLLTIAQLSSVSFCAHRFTALRWCSLVSCCSCAVLSSGRCAVQQGVTESFKLMACICMHTGCHLCTLAACSSLKEEYVQHRSSVCTAYQTQLHIHVFAPVCAHVSRMERLSWGAGMRTSCRSRGGS